MNVEQVKREHYEESTPDTTYGRVKRDLGRIVNWFLSFILYFLPLIFVLLTGSVGLLEMLSIDTGVPEHLVGYVIYWGQGVWLGLFPAALVYMLISSDDDPKLFTYGVESSLLALFSIPKSRFYSDNMTLLSPDGEDMTIDDLDQIHTQKYGRCYLALGYDKKSDIIVTSWFAGMNPIEVRAQKKQLGKALKVMWKLVDSAVDVVSNRQDVDREAAYRKVLQSIEIEEELFLESATEQSAVEDALANSGLETEVIEDIKEEYDRRDEIGEEGDIL